MMPKIEIDLLSPLVALRIKDGRRLEPCTGSNTIVR